MAARYDLAVLPGPVLQLRPLAGRDAVALHREVAHVEMPAPAASRTGADIVIADGVGEIADRERRHTDKPVVDVGPQIGPEDPDELGLLARRHTLRATCDVRVGR